MCPNPSCKTLVDTEAGTRGGNVMGKMLTGMQSHVLSKSKVGNRVATPAIRQEGPVCGQESEMMPDGPGLDTWRMKWVTTSSDGNDAMSWIC